jgi:hypothetical protein
MMKRIRCKKCGLNHFLGPCAWCGREISTHKRARTCSPACRVALHRSERKSRPRKRS